MKDVLTILNKTPEERNSLIFESLLYWAGKQTFTRTQMQMVLINKPIKKWFFMEYEKLETIFVNLVKSFPNATLQHNEDLYARITGDIYEHYPKVLLDPIINKYKLTTDKCLN